MRRSIFMDGGPPFHVFKNTEAALPAPVLFFLFLLLQFKLAYGFCFLILFAYRLPASLYLLLLQFQGLLGFRSQA